MLMVSEGEGIQHACGQFEHAIDSVSPGEKKRKEKKRNKGFFFSLVRAFERTSLCEREHGTVCVYYRTYYEGSCKK
jgi:hypothetical protein